MDIDVYKPQMEQIARKHGLDVIVLFGSQATGRTHQKSDVDVAVLGRQAVNRARLALDLDQVFKRDDVEVVDLVQASPSLMREVVADGRLLYEREQDMFFRWKLYAIKIWMETAWLRRLNDKKLREWVKAF